MIDSKLSRFLYDLLYGYIGSNVEIIHLCHKNKGIAALYDPLTVQTELFVVAIFARLENLTQHVGVDLFLLTGRQGKPQLTLPFDLYSRILAYVVENSIN